MAIYEIDVKNFGKLDKLFKKLDAVFTKIKNITGVLDNVGDSSDKLKAMTDKTKDFNEALNNTGASMLDMAIDDKLDDVADSIDNIAVKSKRLEDATKASQKLNDEFNSLNKNMMKTFGMDNITDKFKNVFDIVRSIGMVMKGGILSSLKSMTILFAKFNGVLLVVSAVSVMMKSLKTAFKFNIGGLQATFKRMQSLFKYVSKVFEMQLFKSLEKFGPMFEMIGQAVEEVIKTLTSKDVLDALTNISDLMMGLTKMVLPAVLAIVKVLANWIEKLAKLINLTFGLFDKGQDRITNNNTNNNNDNRQINYYASSHYDPSKEFLTALNKTY